MSWYKTAKSEESAIFQFLKMNIENYLRNFKGRLEGTRFQHPDQFFLEIGRFFKPQPLTSEEVKIVKEAMKLFRFKAKECYYNAQSLAQKDHNIQYVEGYCFTNFFPFQHAWNTINGKVVDVTMFHRNNGKPILGIFPESWEYFGTDFSVEEIRKMWVQRRMSFPIISYEMNWQHLKDNYPEVERNT